MNKEKKHYFQGMEHLEPSGVAKATPSTVLGTNESSDRTMRKQIRHDLLWVTAILFVLFAGLAVIMVIDRNSNIVNNWAHLVTELFIN